MYVFLKRTYTVHYTLYSVLFAGEGGVQVGPIYVFEHKGGAGSKLAYDRL